MKNIVDIINENIITEAVVPKSIVKLRTGNTIYIMPKGERKAIPVKVVNTIKRPMGRGYEGSYYKDIEFSDNPYVKSFSNAVFKTINYKDEHNQVEICNVDGNYYYIGVSKEAIDEFTKQIATNRINGVIERITKLETELADLYKMKAEIEQDLNTEIFESVLN